jgi:hypothetical protein
VWERHAAETAGFLLVGDGTDIVSAAFDWDDLAAGTGADMVHDHSAAGEGGEVPLASLGSYAQGSIVRGGGANWEAYSVKTAGAVLIGDGTDIVSDTSPTIAGLVTGQVGFIATGYTLAGAPAAADYMVFGMDSPDGRIFAYDPVNSAYLSLLSDVDIYRLRYTSADTNVIHYLLRLEVFTSGTAAAGLGTGIEFQMEDAGGDSSVLGAIQAIETDATAGAEHGALAILTADIGDDGLVERWRWDHDGAIAVAGPSMTVPDDWWVGIGAALERIVFDAAGDITVMGANFGIGTGTAPGQLLTLEQNAASPYMQFHRNQNVGANVAAGGFIFSILGTDVAYILAKTQTTADNDAYIAFHTATGGVLSEQVRIDKDGNVGMNGVTVPSTALDIGAGAFELDEMTAPGGGAANTCRIYAVDNGGRTELLAVFASGAAQRLAIEP